HVREVVPLAQHLRADQRLRRLRAEAVEDAHELPFLPRRVAVEHPDGDVGELAAEALLDLFRAEADRLQHLAAAERALRGQRAPPRTTGIPRSCARTTARSRAL